ncbi:MAG TPA: hypothetical protein VK324_17500 [Tepidisphaeraceae bacterium]|nr:hypothetical protein [Tepidisphaeraceae bacterium]
MSDDDLILLESYLDDELSDAEQASLRNRLTGDPALAAALADVKAERATRQAVWAAMEPSDAEMRSLAAAVQHSTRRREAWAGRARRFGQVAVAAACVVVGLAVGWQSRPAAPPGSGPEVPFVAREMMVDVNENASFAHGREAGVVDADEENRQIQFVGRVLPVRTEPQTVVMTDSRGRVVAVNQFATPDEAREFLADVAHRGFVPHPPASQGAPVRPPVPADRNVVPVSADRF